MIGICILIILLIPLLFFNLGSTEGAVDYTGAAGGGVAGGKGNWRKPVGLNVVALVFYGRRANVQILERYLRVFYLPLLFFPRELFVCGHCFVECGILDKSADGRKIWLIMEGY